MSNDDDVEFIVFILWDENFVFSVMSFSISIVLECCVFVIFIFYFLYFVFFRFIMDVKIKSICIIGGVDGFSFLEMWV